MKNTNLPITSREYKVMLNVANFKDRKQGVKEFWQLIEFLAISQGAKIITADDEDELYQEKNRKTYYLDTEALELKHKGFILRVRKEEKKQKPEYKFTLKYRSPDRYLSASQNLSIEQLDNLSLSEDPSRKFEEDIIPPFSSKFSRSVSLESEQKFNLDTVNEIQKVFPSLKELNIAGNKELKIVNNFVANEVAIKLNYKVIFAPEINDYPIEPVMSFWYLLGTKGELPLVGEFSFDYGSENNQDEKEKLENFPLTVVQGGNQWFATIQKQVNWLNFNSTTKTSFAYEGFAA